MKKSINRPKSMALFNRAIKSIPGGVNSPVRAYSAVGGNPPFIVKGEGPHIFDADGNRYIDLVMSWGPLIAGHAHRKIVNAIEKAAARGTTFGAPTESEIELAEMIKKAFRSIEKVRLVSSGTEATMSALRLARGFTGRDKILKFDGGYHGHSDGLLVKAGSGLATLGVPSSPGVPKDYAKHTLNASYNDLDMVEKMAIKHAADLAAIIVEPVAGNMGVVIPKKGFLAGLRKICDKTGAVLIFDEVITGFRVALGGAQELYKIKADLTCLGKIVGGGLPVGAYGGRKDIMAKISPEGPVYQAGTLSGNPLAMAAGKAIIEILMEPGTYESLDEKGARLERGLSKAADKLGIPSTINRVGSMMTAFFTKGPVTCWDEAAKQDNEMFKKYFAAMLDRGVYLAPSAYEASFVSTEHSDRHIDTVIAAAEESMKVASR